MEIREKIGECVVSIAQDKRHPILGEVIKFPLCVRFFIDRKCLKSGASDFFCKINLQKF